MTIEDRMKLEKAAKAAQHINRDKDSGRFAPEPAARQVSEKKVDEVAVKIAERAGVLVLCHFHRF